MQVNAENWKGKSTAKMIAAVRFFGGLRLLGALRCVGADGNFRLDCMHRHVLQVVCPLAPFSGDCIRTWRRAQLIFCT